MSLSSLIVCVTFNLLLPFMNKCHLSNKSALPNMTLYCKQITSYLETDVTNFSFQLNHDEVTTVQF